MKQKLTSILLLTLFSLSGFLPKAQTLNLTATPTPPTCNNGTNGSITMSATGCPGTVTYTSVPALSFTGNTANNVAPGSYTITGTTPPSGGTQVLYSTNFASASDWTLNVVTGSEGGAPNPWQSGNIGGNQGTAPSSACGPSVSTGLFIKCTDFICNIFGGGGPVYNASSAANNTDRSAHLNTNINTTGLTNITLRFAWRCGGSSQSYGSVRYSINGGTSWIDLPQQYNFNTSWNCATVNLPATTENISNLRIGFRWRNSNNSGDQDPPMVVTNVSVEGTGSGSTSCTGSTTVTVSNPAPATVNVTPSGPLTICAGGNVTLNGQTGFTNYSWQPGGQTTPSITVSSAGTYTLTATNAQGCQASSTQQVVTVTNTTVPIAITPAGPVAICLGQSVTLQAEAGLTNYVWSPGNISGQTLTVNQAGSYSVTAQTAQGCQAASNTPVQVTITTDPLPISVTPSGPLSLCAGQTQTLTAEDGFVNYVWIGGQGAAGQTITVNQAGTYTVSALTPQGCQAISSPISVTVDNNQTFTLIENGPTSLCNGEQLILSIPGGYTNINWSNQSTSNSITVTSPGTFSATATAPSGCSATSNTVTVTTGQPPVASFTYNQINNFNVEFTNTSSGGTSYLWNFGNGNTSTGQNASFNFNIEGTYSVTLIVSNACGSDTVTQNVIVLKLNINQVAINVNMNAYPNPAQSDIIISAELPSAEMITIQVVNTLGQIVTNEQWAYTPGSKHLLDVRSLSAGNYVLLLKTSKGTAAKTIIKN